MPRLFELGEHYDNHQAEITDAFVQRGLIEAAKSEGELASALEQARAGTPVLATTDPSELKAYLEALLLEWSTAARTERTAVNAA
jgi:UDP-N-acetylglucosamine transferase subunit ALG13